MALSSPSPIASRPAASTFASPDLSSFPFTKPAETQPPSLVQRRRRMRCPALHLAAFHTGTSFPDTNTGSKCRAPATLYQVLQIRQTATQAEIKSSYRRLARRYHPDMVATEDKEASTKLFLHIHAAYAALSDAQSRARYDLQLSMEALQARRRTFSQADSTSSIPKSPSSSGSISRKGRSWETDQCW